jgi:hypothetical protein
MDAVSLAQNAGQSNEAALSPEQIELIVSWVSGGAPERGTRKICRPSRNRLLPQSIRAAGSW